MAGALCVVWGGACMAGCVHGGGHAWQGACIVGGMCVVGVIHKNFQKFALFNFKYLNDTIFTCQNGTACFKFRGIPCKFHVGPDFNLVHGLFHRILGLLLGYSLGRIPHSLSSDDQSIKNCKTYLNIRASLQ